jgi:IS1 family transposase
VTWPSLESTRSDPCSDWFISYHVGKRDAESADAFARDLRSRLTMVPHISTDGFPAYPEVIAKHFGGSVDFGTVVKHYRHGAQRGPDHRYEPPRDPFVTKHAIFGAPSMDLIGTAHVERYNLTQRHIVGRTRRLCLAFSKTLRGHRAAIALGVFVYNFVREHATLGHHTTPAIAAGLTAPSVADLPVAVPAAPPAAPSASSPAAPALPSTSPTAPKPRSKRLPPGQLSLFGIDFDPEAKK